MATKIKFRNKSITVFDNLNIGNTFLYKDCLFMKVNRPNSSIRLSEGEMVTFADCTEVTKVDIIIDVIQ